MRLRAQTCTEKDPQRLMGPAEAHQLPQRLVGPADMKCDLLGSSPFGNV